MKTSGLSRSLSLERERGFFLLLLLKRPIDRQRTTTAPSQIISGYAVSQMNIHTVRRVRPGEGWGWGWEAVSGHGRSMNPVSLTSSH